MSLNIANTSIMNQGVVVSDAADLFANNLSVYKDYNAFGGLVSGYVSGTAALSTQKFPFAVSSGGTATNNGALSVLRGSHSGQSSAEYGYTSGGSTPVPAYSNVIDRFPFASTGTSVDVGDLTVARDSCTDASSILYGFGYISGGRTPAYSNVIDRFPFAVATTNATDVGDLTLARGKAGGNSSSDYGYITGGRTPTSAQNVIDRFPFAVATVNASDVGDLPGTIEPGASQSSADYGYSSASSPISSPATANQIRNFPFAAAVTNATNVGTLDINMGGGSGQSSIDYGYHTGGYPVPTGSPLFSTYRRFPFASGTVSSSTVGSIGTPIAGIGGAHQV
jgi:hypothetical protein